MSNYQYTSKTTTIGTSSTTKIFDPNGGIRSADIQNTHATLDARVHFGNPWVLSFDGTNDLIDCDAAATDVATATKGSITAGIYVDSGGTGNRTIFSLSDANTETAFWLRVDTNVKLTASLVIAGTVQWTLSVTNALTVNKWYEVKLVQNGTEPVIYVDGEGWVQSFSVSTDKTAWFADLTGIDTCNIGCLDYNSASDADFFKGDIDFVKVVDGLGTHKDVGTKSLFLPLDEGTGTTVDDRSANANDGTVSGAAWATRGPGIILSADSGRIFHIEDDPDVRKGCWIGNADGSSTIDITHKLAPNAS